MGKYIKTYGEFIKESNSSDSLVDRLYSEAESTGSDPEDVMREYLNQNLKCEEFLNRFKDLLFDELKNSWSEMVEYETPGRDEDGNPDGGSYINGDLEYVEVDMQEDEEFGEFGITFDSTYKNRKTDISIYAFNGELDITESPLGQAMIETYNKLYDLTRDAAINDNDMSVQDEKDLENTYRTIAQGNGWSF